MEINVDVVDNCFLQPLSFQDVQLAFEERIVEWQLLTEEYRSDDVPNALPSGWPLSQFANPEIPIAIYLASTREQNNNSSFLGFLESKIIFNDYAIVRHWVMMNNDDDSLMSQTTQGLMTKFVQDCKDMQVANIVSPRAFSANSPMGGKYNFFTWNASIYETQWIEMCKVLSTEYPFLHFETPYMSRFINVKPHERNQLGPWLANKFLQPYADVRSSLAWYRKAHVSLWLIRDPIPISDNPQALAGRGLGCDFLHRRLNTQEVDIIVKWQRTMNAHQALELNAASVPFRLFGKDLIIYKEHVFRMQVVAYRHRYRVPPHLERIQDVDWAKDDDGIPAVPFLTPEEVYDIGAGIEANARSRARAQARAEARERAREREAEEKQSLANMMAILANLPGGRRGRGRGGRGGGRGRGRGGSDNVPSGITATEAIDLAAQIAATATDIFTARERRRRRGNNNNVARVEEVDNDVAAEEIVANEQEENELLLNAPFGSSPLPDSEFPW